MADYTREELEDMDAKGLALVASSLKLKLRANSTTRADYIDAIMAAQDPSGSGPTANVTSKSDVPEIGKTQASKRRRIIVHHTEGTDASKFVAVQVNGVAYAIPREVEVSVPEEVISVLKDAVATRTVQEGGRLVETPYRRFPFSDLGPA